MINPTPAKIEMILTSSYIYEVPRFQREYRWSKEEATEFLEDLRTRLEEDEAQLFLGTFIFDNSEVGKQQNRIKIVDGQQRITTIILLLIVCRDYAKSINEEGIARATQSLITFVDKASSESLGPRLIASYSIRDVFNEMCVYEWDRTFQTKVGKTPVKRQIKRVKPIYDFFYEQVQSLDKKELIQFLKAIHNAYVVQIEIQDESEAFSIFERTNARGVNLEAADLLKNFLFSQGVENIEESWSQILKNSDDNILRMLKYFYVAHNGYVLKPKLYKKIKGYAKEIGPNLLVEKLLEFSQYYNIIRNGTKDDLKEYLEDLKCDAIVKDQDKYEKIHISLQGLRLFNIAQTYPLMYSALKCFVRNGLSKNASDSSDLIKFFEALEKYHFINNAICDRIGNEIEKLYANYSEKFASSKDFKKTCDEFYIALKDKLATESEFVARFKEISYSSSSIPLIAYLFDRINNYGLRPGQRISIFNPDHKVLRKNHNIEHFAPQSPEKKYTEDELEMIDNIGNLLVISFSTNSKLSNLSPKEKIEKLKGPLMKEVQNLTYVKNFIREYGDQAENWNGELITNRANNLAVTAYKEIWKI